MSSLRALKQKQFEEQAAQVAVGIQNNMINTSTGLPQEDPKNVALFQLEEERRIAAGEGVLNMKF